MTDWLLSLWPFAALLLIAGVGGWLDYRSRR